MWKSLRELYLLNGSKFPFLVRSNADGNIQSCHNQTFLITGINEDDELDFGGVSNAINASSCRFIYECISNPKKLCSGGLGVGFNRYQLIGDMTEDYPWYSLHDVYIHYAKQQFPFQVLFSSQRADGVRHGTDRVHDYILTITDIKDNKFFTLEEVYGMDYHNEWANQSAYKFIRVLPNKLKKKLDKHSLNVKCSCQFHVTLLRKGCQCGALTN